ncbi:hypothetical protein Tco_0853736 [Tanacetum coccineum]
MKDGPRYDVHLNVDKTKVFLPKEDPRSRLTDVFPSNISRSSHGIQLLGGAASVDIDFCSLLGMKRVAKTIVLMDAVAKINDPQCELLLLRSCTRPMFDNWQRRLTTLPFAFGGLSVYFVGDVLNYAFLALRLQSTGLKTKLLRHTGIVASWPNFDDALCVFNMSTETDFLSNPSEIASPKLMKKMTNIYFTRLTKNAESTFSLSPRQIALCKSQREAHTFDWLWTVPISSLFKGFVGDIYEDHDASCAEIIGIKHRHNFVRDTLIDICYRSGILAGLDVCVDLTGSSHLTQTGMVDFVPSRAIIGVGQRKCGKYMDKCAAIEYAFLPFSFSSLEELEVDAVALLKRIRKSGISGGKEMDIGLGGGQDKHLRPADMLFYSWDGGIDVWVDLTNPNHPFFSSN